MFEQNKFFEYEEASSFLGDIVYRQLPSGGTAFINLMVIFVNNA